QQLSRAKTAKQKINLHYALAKELEDLKDYATGFNELSSGAKIQRQSLNYNSQSEILNIQNLINTFTAENYSQITDSTLTEAPIFIVGLPRSGTTLVERIIGQHQGIKSAGETSDFTITMSAVINQYLQDKQSEHLSPLRAALSIDYTKIGNKYLANMHNMLGVSTRTIDKLPFNFLYCGLIKKAFPNARIIHLVREPLDSCYAMFKTLFNQSYFFSYDLEELAEYYCAYRKLMAHWHDVIPEGILDVQYENL
ncbi:sulfotransferase family protein, partial [Paraglaciecola hydrolytica]|uniref:sulfotransferase family protein n=1 Tax=Paraglaciecola hydrolytica TaxID=1799789 RepID=UPI0010420A3F